MKHILVTRLSAMGDVAMTVPVIRALIHQHKNITITVVSRPFFKPLFNGIERVNFFSVDLEKRHKGIWGIYQLYQDLKSLNIDLVADLHNVLRSKILRTLFAFSKIKTAYTDKGRKEKKALTNTKNKIFSPVKPMIERHIDTFKKLGYSINMAYDQLPQKNTLSDKIKAISGTKKNLQWIGIAPFAQYRTKVYPLDLMAKTISLLAEKDNVKIFLFGGKKDLIQLSQLQQKINNVIVIADKLSFSEELQLIQHLDLMISMDSANAHLAAMYGVKVLSLWGNTHPYAGFVPYAQPLSHSLTADRKLYPLIPTSIYGNKEIPGYLDVMRTISPQDVLKKAEELLQ